MIEGSVFFCLYWTSLYIEQQVQTMVIYSYRQEEFEYVSMRTSKIRDSVVDQGLDFINLLRIIEFAGAVTLRHLPLVVNTRPFRRQPIKLDTPKLNL